MDCGVTQVGMSEGWTLTALTARSHRPSTRACGLTAARHLSTGSMAKPVSGVNLSRQGSSLGERQTSGIDVGRSDTNPVRPVSRDLDTHTLFHRRELDARYSYTVSQVPSLGQAPRNCHTRQRHSPQIAK